MFFKLLILWFYIIPFIFFICCIYVFINAYISHVCIRDLYVKTQKDIDYLSHCTIFVGEIYINCSISTIYLRNTQNITGNLIVLNSTVINVFSAPELETVNGKLEFTNLTMLQKILLPKLTTINSLVLFQCAQLESLVLEKGISNANTVLVSDTSLRTLSGFFMKTLFSLIIDNNKYLNYFNIKTLVEVKGPFSFIQNGRVKNHNGVSVSFPSLESTGDLTLQSVAYAEFINLKTVKGHLVLTLATIRSFVLEKLQSIKESLSIYNNSELDSLSFPSLTSIGGTFLLRNNGKLTAIHGFPNVSSIGGSLSWSGPLVNISLPSISDIKGTVLIESSSSLTCPPFVKSSAVVQGASSICKSFVDSKTGGTSDSRKNSYTKLIGGNSFYLEIQLFLNLMLKV
ncbi:hypothetical protein PCK1_002262 [Pneumocystis canis]|nr:hypothetical protein PCK1_002262 [Pneumocystis canis]